jgi:hypothetical protein
MARTILIILMIFIVVFNFEEDEVFDFFYLDI